MSLRLALGESFKKALPIINKIEEHGYEAYFVGGSVRDALLDMPIHDVDIATSAYPVEMKRMFDRTIDVGIDHGTVMVLFEGETYEITTFRTESEYADFRRPDSVEFVRSLKEDLKRRDFTINALAMDKEGRIVDYFNGLQDLEEKRIKAVGDPQERFHEDALRMMRAVRFVAHLQFHLDDRTRSAIKENHVLLDKIAVERIQTEFVKLLLGPGRCEGLKEFVVTGLFEYCPKLDGKSKHLSTFAEAGGRIYSQEVAWALLMHFLNVPFEEIDGFMRAWKCSKKVMTSAEAIYRHIGKRLERPLDRWDIYALGLEDALRVEEAASMLKAEPNKHQVKQVYTELPIHQLSELSITGRDLMAYFEEKPGRWLGDVLSAVERETVVGNLANEKNVLLSFAEEWLASHGSQKGIN